MYALPTYVKVPNPDPVGDYLARHLDITPVLLKVLTMTHQEFQDTATLTLEISADKYTADEYLALYVRQAEYDPQIRERIERLWGKYGSDLQSTSGWLLVTTDFRHL